MEKQDVKGKGRKFVSMRLRVIIVMMLCALLLSSCSGNTQVVFTTGFEKDEVFRINDIGCYTSEFMVYLTNIQNQYESVYGDGIWEASKDGVTLEDNVKEIALAKIAQIKTMYLMALERGVELTAEDEELVEEAAEAYYGSLNETEVESMGVSPDTIYGLYTEYAMAYELYQEIIEEINPEISDDEARIMTAEHIFIRTYYTDEEGNITPYSESEKEEAYATAKDILKQVSDGERSFEDLAASYSDDETITYSFGKGGLDEAFEETAFSLETGQVSDIVETEWGYHIIKCVSTLEREETDANKQKIMEQRRNEAFGEEYDAFVDTLTKRLNEDKWNEIELIHDDEVNTVSFFDVYEKYFL